MFAMLMMQHAEQVQCVSIFLLLHQDLLIQLGGGPKLPGPMHFNGSRQGVLHRAQIKRLNQPPFAKIRDFGTRQDPTSRLRNRDLITATLPRAFLNKANLTRAAFA